MGMCDFTVFLPYGMLKSVLIECFTGVFMVCCSAGCCDATPSGATVLVRPSWCIAPPWYVEAAQSVELRPPTSLSLSTLMCCRS